MAPYFNFNTTPKRAGSAMLQRLAQRKTHLLAAVLMSCAGVAQAVCFEEAGRQFNISPLLLHAIALQESGLDPKAIGHNRDGSHDIGLMQINSRHLPRLAKKRITEKTLLNDSCQSVKVPFAGGEDVPDSGRRSSFDSGVDSGIASDDGQPALASIAEVFVEASVLPKLAFPESVNIAEEGGGEPDGMMATRPDAGDEPPDRRRSASVPEALNVTLPETDPHDKGLPVIAPVGLGRDIKDGWASLDDGRGGRTWKKFVMDAKGEYKPHKPGDVELTWNRRLEGRTAPLSVLKPLHLPVDSEGRIVTRYGLGNK